jgi:hypothetical protein
MGSAERDDHRLDLRGDLVGAPWPFGIVELVWAGVALRRYQRRSQLEHGSTR